MMTISAQRCLIIPDVHQGIGWVERVLAREQEADRIVFLGDYFDSRRPATQRAGIAETCVYLDALRVRLGERAIFLLGNHDVQYLEARAACLARRTPRRLRYHCGAAFSHSAAKRIAKDLSPEFWAVARLFVSVDGWLLSHAGVAAAHWPLRATPADSLRAFDEACAAALETITAPLAAHPLLGAGRVRGGDAEVGGVTWLDWDDEFADELPFPQIVGHTSDASGARRRGRSWCIDGVQSCYGVLTGSELVVRSV